MCQTTNPASTGQAGPAFETLVGAAFLATLLARGAPLGLGAGTLEAVHFQAGHLGRATEDFLLEATSASGQKDKAAIQVKRSFVLSRSNTESVQTIRRAFSDFQNPTLFNQNRDVVALVTSSLSARLVRGLRTLLDCARAATSSEDMIRRLDLPAYLGKPTKEYYETIVSILQTDTDSPPDSTEIWRFLRRFPVYDLDFETPNGLAETMIRSILMASLPTGEARLAEATWNELIVASLRNAGAAASYLREQLPDSVLQRHTRLTGFSGGVSRLLEDTAIVSNFVRNTINGALSLPRSELVSQLCQSIEDHQITLLVGEAGSGKSALAKDAFSLVTLGSLGFAFRAESLAGNHINDVLRRFDLTLEGLRSQTALQGRKLLWIDGLERLLEKPSELRLAFLDLLRGLKVDPTWRLLMTCRNYSADTVKNAFFGEVGIESQDLTVGDFDDAELAEISSAIPGLRRPLSQNPLRQLLRRPFFLDKAARMNWPETELLPANERELRKKVWNEVVKKNDEGQFEGIPARRGQVMVSIAFRRARAMEPYVLGASEDPGILHRLAQDSLLSQPSADQNLFAPGHDAFEDWALMQWLDDEFAANGGRIDALFSEVGTYPALRRSYRKWLTELLDSSPQTADRLILEVIRNAALPAHWRDDTLVATLLSKDADTFLSRNSTALLRDHGALMWQTIHLLRVACQYAIPRTACGLSGEGFMFLPRGSAWFSTAEILEAAIPQLTNERFPLILEFLEKWRLLTRLGVAYPRAVRSVMNLAFHFLPYADAYECPVQDADKRLLALILTFPGAARQQVTNLVTRALGEGHRGREGVLALIFNHFYSEAIFRDMADLGYRVAEHALYLNIPLDQLIGGRSGFEISEMEDAFALGGRAHEDHPSSAFHGPYARMLQFDPQRGIDFIIRFINRCCDAFAHLDNEVQFVEPPFTVRFKLPDGSYSEQYANDRLWAAYRAASVVPDTFASALMALERWLLDEAHRGATTIDELLTSPKISVFRMRRDELLASARAIS